MRMVQKRKKETIPTVQLYLYCPLEVSTILFYQLPMEKYNRKEQQGLSTLASSPPRKNCYINYIDFKIKYNVILSKCCLFSSLTTPFWREHSAHFPVELWILDETWFIIFCIIFLENISLKNNNIYSKHYIAFCPRPVELGHPDTTNILLYYLYHRFSVSKNEKYQLVENFH